MKIPVKEDYMQFLDNFSKSLSIELPNACFYVYGSLNNCDCNYGRSDIDGGIILGSGVITPKDKIIRLSELFLNALNNYGLQTQFNLLDLETCRDGRFLSYTEDYTNWIKESAKVHSGPNLLGELNGRDFKSGVLYSAAFNFCGPGGVRNSLLYSLVHAHQDNDDFKERTSRALEKVAKFPKKLLWLRGQGIIPSRIKARQRLAEILEDANLEIIDEINDLLANPKELYSQLEDLGESVRLLSSSLGCMEGMVASYIKHFPQVSQRELKL